MLCDIGALQQSDIILDILLNILLHIRKSIHRKIGSLIVKSHCRVALPSDEAKAPLPDSVSVYPWGIPMVIFRYSWA